MTCDNIRDFFAEALYGELDPRRMEEFNHHIATCASCRAEFEGLKGTLALMNERTRIEPTPSEWVEFSKRLDEKLTAESAGTAREGMELPPSDGRAAHDDETGRDGAFVGRSISPTGRVDRSSRASRGGLIPFLVATRPAWAYGAAAVLLLAFGIYMGRTFFGGDGATDAPSPDRETLTSASPSDTHDEQTGSVERDGTGAPAGTGRPGRTTERVTPSADETNKDALAYLERSRNLLIGLTNLDAKQSAVIDLSRQRQVSRQLYDQGNVLTVALNRPSQQQLRQLVQNLQIILLQLTNMEVGKGTPAIELVRQGVDSKSILLKINLEAIRASLGEAQANEAGGAGNKIRQNL